MKFQSKINNRRYIIRNANLSDIDKLLPMEEEAYGKHHWSYKSFYNELTNKYANYFVCTSDDLDNQSNIIGYIGYWKVFDEGHITNMVVGRVFQGLGVADILLYSLILNSLKQKIKWLTLEVRRSNSKAIHVYSKFQFNQLGIRKEYYQDNSEDALILWTGNIHTNEYSLYAKGIVLRNFVLLSNTDKL